MKNIEFAKGLTFPTDFVTQAIGILAKRRAGKSYTARRLVEQLERAKQQVVIVDPKGDWWGIRHAADGKKPGLPIVIIGGEHGDVKLEPSGGEVVAKLVVEERVSVLLDLAQLRKHEVATFMTAFLETLYRLKAREQYRTPMMLVIDEADAIAPQKPPKGEERMLGAAEDIVRRGGQRGIGCTMITQRSAVLNKNVLTQIQVLIALRTIAPQDLAAMNAWIDVHGTDEQRKTLMESLPSLPIGDAWVWSPGWPSGEGIFQRVHVSPIETFDSGATPEPGKQRHEPKEAAAVNLDALSRAMAATIAEANANDPKKLKVRVAQLEKELATAKAVKPTEKHVDVRVAAIEPVTLRELKASLVKHAKTIEAQSVAAPTIMKALEAATRMLERFDGATGLLPVPAQRASAVTVPTPNGRRNDVKFSRSAEATPRPSTNARAPASEEAGLGGAARRILLALASLHPTKLTRRQVATLIGVKPTTGSFGNNLSQLRVVGFMSSAGEDLWLTEAGVQAAGPVEQPIGSTELVALWRSKLSGVQARMLDLVLERHPNWITREEIAEQLGVSPDTGSFGNNVSALHSNGLVEKVGKEIRASPSLFLGGAP